MTAWLMEATKRVSLPWLGMLAFLAVTLTVYLPGLDGGYFFDDYPNIVDNPNLRIDDLSIANLVRSALSSPSSEFRRPLASLSFSMNYLLGGDAPFGMKLTNLLIHLVNGVLTFVLLGRLFVAGGMERHRAQETATWCAGAWMLLPINLTAVLYIVQRMESLAHMAVLAGLIGYVVFRQRMQVRYARRDTAYVALSLGVPVLLGVMAKEVAVMLPLYAFAIECLVFHWRSAGSTSSDRRVLAVFVLLLLLPLALGLAWLIPGLMTPGAWATRDFTMTTRLLTETRVVLDYIIWTLVPTPEGLAFYHDDFVISQGWLLPWTTAASTLALLTLGGIALACRRRAPWFSLGVALFFASHLLTATILPLELVYEHRNYFASLGLVVALMTSLLAIPWRVVRLAGAGVALVGWTSFTAASAYDWGDSLRLAETLAQRGPESPRAQYELGRAYIIKSGYASGSPYTAKAYPPLLRAAAIPGATILPEQALIFFNARLGRPIEREWWGSMEAKLRNGTVTVQDESALIALVQCDRSEACPLPHDAMDAVFRAAINHPSPSARLLATYGDFAWNSLRDKPLGLRLISRAVARAPTEPAYRISLVRMLAAEGELAEAKAQRRQLDALNIGGSLDDELAGLDRLLDR